MSRVAVITVAGVSSRFNKGIPDDDKVLKCLYTEGDERDTLLYHLLIKVSYADQILLVGGYKYYELKQYVDATVFSDLRKRIRLVFNDHYEDLSSGYSLHLGLNVAFEECIDIKDILFVEGDLDVDTESMEAVIRTTSTVLTYNYEPIKAEKAVVLYVDGDGRYNYAFDSTHGLLSIKSSFKSIYNSGQVWKFMDIDALMSANEVFVEKHIEDTNLALIQDYLNCIPSEQISVMPLKNWTNCNTREDFDRIKERWKNENS